MALRLFFCLLLICPYIFFSLKVLDHSKTIGLLLLDCIEVQLVKMDADNNEFLNG